MDPVASRRLSLVACLLVPALPAAAGMIAFRAQPILAAGIQGDPGRLPFLTDLFFNHFGGALLALLGVSLALALLAIAQLRRADEGDRLGSLLVMTCASALTGVLFLGLFVLAAALPLYARLTER